MTAASDPALPRNPYPTVDVVVERSGGRVVLIRRKNPPLGWALPGGFIDRGETAEAAARREVQEELGVRVQLKLLLGVYSDPARDPRHHTLSVVFVGHSSDRLQAGDDADECAEFDLDDLPSDLAFDHRKILNDYRYFRATGAVPGPVA